MKDLVFKFEDCLIDISELYDKSDIIYNELEHMKNTLTRDYEDLRASLTLIDDKTALSKVKEMISDKMQLNPSYLVVVGIGGSNLGSVAVQEAILGKLYNQLNLNIKILFAETVDSDVINNIINIIEPVLRSGGNVIVNGVSKSGSTTETIANFEVIFELIKKYKKDFKNYIVITTDKDSKFWQLAEESGFSILEIPKKVGGRFSVFSPVGLFPLGMLGLDLDALLAGAGQMRDRCLRSDINQNPAALSALLLFQQITLNRINIHDLFLFSCDLESLGKWYRQLLGESLGKEFDRLGAQVHAGITPSVSIGSTDLHSVGQLYLGGPYDKFTTFVSVEHLKSQVKIPELNGYSDLVANIQNRPLNDLMQAILQGVKAAYRVGKRPFIEIILPDKTESSIGQFLQLKMMETMFLGALMNLNPFNQPNVENYKSETRKILAMK